MKYTVYNHGNCTRNSFYRDRATNNLAYTKAFTYCSWHNLSKSV